MLDLATFSSKFAALTKDWTWEIEGFLDTRGYVHPIDSDTKVISTVFERLASPVVRTIAKEYGYQVELANQTTYPDFTLSLRQQRDGPHRLAIDVKTTYLSRSMVLTLGGYNSFIRNETKNILYPYSTYHAHWVLGFVYAQNPLFEEYDLSGMPVRGDIPCPYKDVTVFMRDKHALAGIRAGSGNTKNIGSVKVSDPSSFATVRGPFLRFTRAKDACDHYWKSYEIYQTQIFSGDELFNHPDFAVFR
jgi:hypothetical protein